MQNEIITLLKEKNLTEARKRLVQLNEADIAELFDELSNEEIICLFRLLSKSTGAEVFAYLEPDVQQKVIEAMTDKELKEVLDDLHMDDAADLLEEMPANIVKRVLQACAPQMRGTSVSYTHLDVYKRQVKTLPKNVTPSFRHYRLFSFSAPLPRLWRSHHLSAQHT